MRKSLFESNKLFNLIEMPIGLYLKLISVQNNNKTKCMKKRQWFILLKEITTLSSLEEHLMK